LKYVLYITALGAAVYRHGVMGSNPVKAISDVRKSIQSQLLLCHIWMNL